MLIKPMLAKDVVESKLAFPLLVLPKIDGSFAFIQEGRLLARSLKQHENKATTEYFSKPEFEGLRGELILGANPTAEGLCRDTSSALRTQEEEPFTTLWVFDYVTEDSKGLPYEERWNLALQKVCNLQLTCNRIFMIPATEVYDLKGYKFLRDSYLAKGYEGCVVRNPKGKHKEGRSSSVSPDLMRYKPYATAEILVTGITEGNTNLNEATTNELGRTKRSTHKENMKASGVLGSIQGNLLEDLTDYAGNVILVKGSEVTVSRGEMKAHERKYYFENPCEIVGKLVEFGYTSYGLKDKPRFATFKRIRSNVDMS